jgi:hypothetical protein
MLVMRLKNRPVRFSLSDASYTLREVCEPASEISAPLPWRAYAVVLERSDKSFTHTKPILHHNLDRLLDE